MSSEPFVDQFLEEGLNSHSNVSRRYVGWIVCGILLVSSMRGQFFQAHIGHDSENEQAVQGNGM